MKNELFNHKPGLSIVISTCNRIDNLLKLIEQLLQQKELTCSYEILIVNDNGPEECLRELYSSQILNSSPVPIRLFNTFYDGYGLALARNVGLRFAEYNNVVFLDDDLEIDNHFLHYYQQAPYGIKAGRIDFEVEVNAETHPIPDYRPIMDGRHTQVLPAEDDILGMVWGGNMAVPTMPALIIGGFDEAFLDEGEEDMDFGARMILTLKQLVLVPQARAVHKGANQQIAEKLGLPFIRRPGNALKRLQNRDSLKVNDGIRYWTQAKEWDRFFINYMPTKQASLA